MHARARSFPVTSILLAMAVPAAAQVQPLPGLSRQGHAPRPVEREVNRAPEVTASIGQWAELLRNGPFSPLQPTPVSSEDDLVFVVRVTDPDGDAVSLSIAEPWEGLRIERVGGSASDAFYQVRLRVPSVTSSGIFYPAPESIVLEARDAGSPPAKTRLVRDLRHQLDGREVSIGDVTGDGTLDLVQFVGVPPRHLNLFAGEQLGSPPVTFPISNDEAPWTRLRDLTGDGILDIVHMRTFDFGPGSSYVSVIPGGAQLVSGNTSEIRLNAGFFGDEGWLEFADVTGDGVADVVHGTDHGFAVWQGPLTNPPAPPLVSVPWSCQYCVSMFPPICYPCPLTWMRLIDVTDDGILDVVVAAQDHESDTGVLRTGRLLVFAGGPTMSTQPTAMLVDSAGTMDTRLGDGIFFEDVTGDGVNDAISWARQATVNGQLYAGMLYVWIGPLGSGTLDVDAHLTQPVPVAQSLLRLDKIADVTGDGIYDLIALAGGTTVIFGGGTGLESDATADATLLSQLEGLLDVNGDFVLDVATVGRLWAGGPGLVATGNPPPLAILDGGGYTTQYGFLRGDVTGDGVLDLVERTFEGPLLVWDGSVPLTGTIAPSAMLVPPSGSGSCLDLADLVDLTGDGVLDVVGHFPYARVDGVSGAGAVPVWHGGPGLTGVLSETALLARATPGQDDWLGRDGLWFEDLNGDGILDVVPSGKYATVGGVIRAGEHDVFLGGPTLAGRVPAAAALSAAGQGVPELRGIVDVTGDGIPDLVTSATGPPIWLWSDPASNPPSPIVLSE